MTSPVPVPAPLPICRAEMDKRNWQELDILLIGGDAYVDHPSFGIAIIGRVLENCGYRVGMIPQPDWKTPESLKIMGRPRIGVGVTSGNLDSMVSIYTAGRRLRKDDAFSEDGQTGKKPPHALTVYCQLVRQAFPGIPVVAGGLEASLRRVAHYDYWQDKIRPSVLVDSKADILCYGMGERTMPEIFRRIEKGETLRGIRGTAVLLGKKEAEDFNSADYVDLPSLQEMEQDRSAIMRETIAVESQMNSYGGKGLIQHYGGRLLVVEPPAIPLDSSELDAMHRLPFTRRPHHCYKGRIPAYETVRDSIMAVRGCPGGCAFCGLVAHQGRQVMSRSPESILREIEELTKEPFFKGTISDIGGAAGNIYASYVADPERCKLCRRASCLFPAICPNYHCDGLALLKLLRSVEKIPGVKHLYINSGIRLDLALRQKELLKELIDRHVSGHMKVAPEHLSNHVLKLMRKNPAEEFFEFVRVFEEESKRIGKEQYLIPLLISNFPGCTDADMKIVDDYFNSRGWSLQQVQDYIPLPMTMGAAMYYSGIAPDGTPIEVHRGLAERRGQIEVLKKRRSFGHGSRPPRPFFANRKKR